MNFRLPGNTHRTTLVGSTGSGKTQMGAWLLSKQNYTEQPWVIVDFKLDELLNAIDRTREIGLDDLPRQPGLYIMHPHPQTDEALIDNWLMRAWERGKTGLFFDEAYMLPTTGDGIKAVYTQGRAKHIPIIAHTQRPTRISRFILSEASHFAVFHLGDRKDRQEMKRFIPQDPDHRLPRFHAHWYDQSRDYANTILPVPPAEKIVADIDARLQPKRRWL